MATEIAPSNTNQTMERIQSKLQSMRTRLEHLHSEVKSRVNSEKAAWIKMHDLSTAGDQLTPQVDVNSEVTDVTNITSEIPHASERMEREGWRNIDKRRILEKQLDVEMLRKIKNMEGENRKQCNMKTTAIELEIDLIKQKAKRRSQERELERKLVALKSQKMLRMGLEDDTRKYHLGSSNQALEIGDMYWKTLKTLYNCDNQRTLREKLEAEILKKVEVRKLIREVMEREIVRKMEKIELLGRIRQQHLMKEFKTSRERRRNF